MGKRSPVQALEDILQAIADIKQMTRKHTLATYSRDKVTQYATERCLLIIAEAAKHLPSPLTARAKDIPWQQIRGVGDVLRHDYENIQPTRVWNIIEVHLTKLGKACRKLRDAQPGK